jgi:CBS domain-containing protein
MRIADFCTRQVITCQPSDSAATLARLMREHHVGDVVVTGLRDGVVTPVGIVTDRDLVVRLMATGMDADTVTAADVMNPAVCALESELAYDAVWHLRRQGCRRLPVVDERDALVGLVTADDLMRFLATELGELTRISPEQPEREHERLDPAAARA